MGRAPLQFGVILWRVMRPRVLIAIKRTSDASDSARGRVSLQDGAGNRVQRSANRRTAVELIKINTSDGCIGQPLWHPQTATEVSQ
jgi:hypothetical protein